MDTTTFVNTTQRVKDSVSKVPEKVGVMLPSELKPSFSTLSMQLVMSQGKVHARLSCCKKVSWSYYKKPLQKEMTFAKFVFLPSEVAHSTTSSGGYAQRIHPLLSDQISQLVAAGITDTNEVKRSCTEILCN